LHGGRFSGEKVAADEQGLREATSPGETQFPGQHLCGTSLRDREWEKHFLLIILSDLKLNFHFNIMISFLIKISITRRNPF